MKAKFLSILAVLSIATLVLMPSNVCAQIPGDIDEDGDVDILDITKAASQYRLAPEDPGYNATIVELADLAEPFGVIDIYDLVTMIYYFTGSS